MDYNTDQDVEDLLARVGKGLAPDRQKLQALLDVSLAESQTRSPLLTISTYMSTYTKIGTALLAIVVIAGGAYIVTTPRGTEVALQKSMNAMAPSGAPDSSAASDTGATATMAATASPTAATDSFDDFATSLHADAQAQAAAVASVDQSTSAGVSSANTVNSSSQPYDPASI